MAAIACSRGGEVLINCKSCGWNMFFQRIYLLAARTKGGKGAAVGI